MILSQTSEKAADLFVYDRLVERERSRLSRWRVGFKVVLLSLTWAVLFTDDIAHASYIAE
jgi:hypothetical protein